MKSKFVLAEFNSAFGRCSKERSLVSESIGTTEAAFLYHRTYSKTIAVDNRSLPRNWYMIPRRLASLLSVIGSNGTMNLLGARSKKMTVTSFELWANTLLYFPPEILGSYNALFAAVVSDICASVSRLGGDYCENGKKDLCIRCWDSLFIPECSS